MERVIEVSMDHTDETQTPGWLKALILECLEEQDNGTICNICEERVVELAIRKSYDELYSITTAIILFEPTSERSLI